MAKIKTADGEQGPKGDWTKIFGWNVRYLRKERSLTQKNLGVLLGVHGSTISNWETHKIIPYSSTLSNIANLFEVTVDELIFKDIALFRLGCGTERKERGMVNTGKDCAGDSNSGHWNSGHSNSGHWNSGDSNSGDSNSGHWNSGDWNSGHSNSGHWNSGDSNSGDSNSGHWNSGDRNSGHWNSGDFNSGHWNSGDWNSGDSNSGHWNSGDSNSGDCNSGDWNKASQTMGCFNTQSQKLRFFDKETDMTFEEWGNSDAYWLLYRIDLRPVVWIWSDEMTDEEKTEHPEHKTTGGYLKIRDNTDCCIEWWDDLSDHDKNIIKNIPNFDAEKFYYITGIRMED